MVKKILLDLEAIEEELDFVKHMLDRYAYTKGHKLIREYKYKGNRIHKPLEALVDTENYIVLGGEAIKWMTGNRDNLTFISLVALLYIINNNLVIGGLND